MDELQIAWRPLGELDQLGAGRCGESQVPSWLPDRAGARGGCRTRPRSLWRERPGSTATYQRDGFTARRRAPSGARRAQSCWFYSQ
jgi:hypothetical protein